MKGAGLQRTTLESLRVLHDRPGVSESKKVNARGRARLLAKRLNQPVPSWAVHQPAVKKSKGGAASKRGTAPTSPTSDPSAAQRALLSWRGQNGGHAVVTHADGRVTLRRGSVFAGDAEEATFPTAAAAAAALEPRIEWRKVARPERSFAAPHRARGRSAGAPA